MSRIFKKLNIEDESPERVTGPDLKLVPDAEDAPRPLKLQKKQRSRIRVSGIQVLFAFVVVGSTIYFTRHKPVFTALSNFTAQKAAFVATPAAEKKLEGDSKLHAEALELYRTGDFVKALEKFNQLLKKHPADAALCNNVGMAYLKLKDFKRAETSFMEALKTEPKDGATYNNLGSLKMAQLDSEDAIAYFYQALLYHPEMIEPHLNLAKAFELAGRPMESIPEYQYYLEHTQVTGDPAIRKLIEQRIIKLNSFARYIELRDN